MRVDKLDLIVVPPAAAVTVAATALLMRLPSVGAQLLAVSGLTGVVAVVVVVMAYGASGPASVLLGAAVLLLPLNGIRRGGVTASDVVLVAAAALSLLHPGLLHRPVVLPRWFGIGLSVFVIAGALGTLTAGQGEGVANFGRLLATMLGAVVGVVLWRPGIGQVRRLAHAWLVGNTVNVAVAVTSMPALDGRRPSGLTTHPNALGLVCALSVGFAVFVYSVGGRRDRWLAVVFTAVSLVGMAVSGSRAAGLATVAVLLARCLLAGRWRAAFIGIVAGAAAWAAVVRIAMWLPDYSTLNRLLHPSSSVEQSNLHRLEHLRDSIAAVEAHPWTGRGFAAATFAHDVALQVAVAAGIVGLAGFALACWPTLGALWARNAGPWRWLGLPPLAYFVAAAVSNNLWDRYVWFALGLGTLAYVTARQPSERGDDLPDLHLDGLGCSVAERNTSPGARLRRAATPAATTASEPTVTPGRTMARAPTQHPASSRIGPLR
jgi:hypothetical protein